MLLLLLTLLYKSCLIAFLSCIYVSVYFFHIFWGLVFYLLLFLNPFYIKEISYTLNLIIRIKCTDNYLLEMSHFIKYAIYRFKLNFFHIDILKLIFLQVFRSNNFYLKNIFIKWYFSYKFYIVNPSVKVNETVWKLNRKIINYTLLH